MSIKIVNILQKSQALIIVTVLKFTRFPVSTDQGVAGPGGQHSQRSGRGRGCAAGGGLRHCSHGPARRYPAPQPGAVPELPALRSLRSLARTHPASALRQHGESTHENDQLFTRFKQNRQAGPFPPPPPLPL